MAEIQNEEWKYIEGTDNKYLISNFGRVASLRLRKGVLRISTERHGYKFVNIEFNGKQRHFYLHRLVALAFIPNPHGYKEINHIDGNKANNYVGNLEWCTRSYNMKYNFQVLGYKGHPMSEEAKQKMSELWKGKQKSEETKQKISLSMNRYFHVLGHKGHPISEEHKKHLRELYKGKPRSEEIKAKISQSLKRHFQQQREKQRQKNGIL